MTPSVWVWSDCVLYTMSSIPQASTAVLGGCLMVSLLIHLHTCWAKGSARLRRRPPRASANTPRPSMSST